jgi:hypothetical protein
MICLATLSGTWMLGCLKTSTVPPPASLGHLPRTPPSITHLRPLPSSPTLPAQPGYPSANPWKTSVAPRDWKFIVIHHTASSSGSVESIHEAHLQRKDKAGNPWLGIGYHFVIGNGNGLGDGAIEPTFRWREQMHGAHAGNDEYNQKGIGIVLVGNFEEQSPSPAQVAAVKRLVATLKSAYHIPADQVLGHGDVKATACPGKYFPLAEVSRSSFSPSLTYNNAATPWANFAAATGAAATGSGKQ